MSSARAAGSLTVTHARLPQEKFYFSPGDTGFKVAASRVYGFRVGVAICWDQVLRISCALQPATTAAATTAALFRSHRSRQPPP